MTSNVQNHYPTREYEDALNFESAPQPDSFLLSEQGSRRSYPQRHLNRSNIPRKPLPSTTINSNATPSETHKSNGLHKTENSLSTKETPHQFVKKWTFDIFITLIFLAIDVALVVFAVVTGRLHGKPIGSPDHYTTLRDICEKVWLIYLMNSGSIPVNYLAACNHLPHYLRWNNRKSCKEICFIQTGTRLCSWTARTDCGQPDSGKLHRNSIPNAGSRNTDGFCACNLELLAPRQSSIPPVLLHHNRSCLVQCLTHLYEHHLSNSRMARWRQCSRAIFFSQFAL